MIKLIQCECEVTDLKAYWEVFRHEVVKLNSPVKVLVIDSRMSVVTIYEQVEHVVGCLGGGATLCTFSIRFSEGSKVCFKCAPLYIG